MIHGAYTALVTPFKNGKVNYEKLGELIEFQITNKIDGIVICGTTGESSCLTDKEKKKVIKYTVETVNGRVPVIAGTGTNDTKHAIELSKYAESIGIDGILLVTITDKERSYGSQSILQTFLRFIYYQLGLGRP